VKGTGTDLHVERLHDDTALLGPIILQGLDQALEATQIGCWQLAHWDHGSKVHDYS
jgi:hypothetical protein